MAFVSSVDKKILKEENNKRIYPIFNYDNAPINHCCAMVIVFNNTEYLSKDTHEDNEGFYVVSGNGTMMIADEEYCLSPGCAMYVPKGVTHAIKRTGDAGLEIFIYHFPE